MPKVEVIVPDNIIIVNGNGIVFDEPFPHEDSLLVLRWNGDATEGQGYMQFSDDYDMMLSPQLYEEEVTPYIALWQEERAKREQAVIEQEAANKRYYSSPEYLLMCLRDAKRNYMAEYDNAISQLERMERLTESDEQKEQIAQLKKQWDIFAEKLCALTDDPNSPWDGGATTGEANSVPWPEMPPAPKSIIK